MLGIDEVFIGCWVLNVDELLGWWVWVLNVGC